MRDRRTNNNLRPAWILCSTLLHAALLALMLWLGKFESSLISDKQVVNITIVQRGKKRDEDLLPRQVEKVEQKAEVESKKDEQTAPPVVAKVQEQIKPEKHKLVKKEVPKKEEKKAGSQAVSALDALKKRVKEMEQGDEKGFDDGNSVFGDLVDSYAARVKAILLENFVLPSYITRKEAERLQIKIFIKVDAQGRPGAVVVRKPSANPEYDHAIASAVKMIKSFGAPPLIAQNTYKNQGVPVTMCPFNCLED